MSVWAKVKTEIKDLQTFLEICERNNLSCREGKNGSYTVNMKDGSGFARMNITADGGYELSYDQDPKYSMFARTFGSQGGTLMRDYATEIAKREAMSMGMSILGEETREDGSIRLILGAVAI